MKVFDLFSKRQKTIRGEVPDVYSYDVLPNGLKTQIVHILLDTLGRPDDFTFKEPVAYKLIVETLCREYGLFVLPTANGYGHREYIAELINFFLQESDTEKCLDVVELSFRIIDRATRSWDYLMRQDASERADDAIAELNIRFREHGIGYHFVSGEIVRIDSQIIHQDVVLPALRLLNQKHFAGAEQEFLAAHAHYRTGKTKEAMNDCLKAFESVMKAICQRRGWNYSPSSTAKELIDVCIRNNLLPSFWQTAFGSLRTLLESSVPTGRNKLSGHGQGESPQDVPDFVGAYMIHMTAAAIVFLAEAEAVLG